ncbi:MAG: hypothetical protein KH354_02675 [Clostridiales bacterium]|nr:hypothetical protein [Clostridiales bacterium]
MKRFLVAVLIVAMVSMMGLVAFAAYPTASESWNIKAVVDVDAGTVTFTYEVKGLTPAWTEMAIYESKPNFEGKDMTDEGAPFKLAIGRANNATYQTERVIKKGTTGNADEWSFEEGKTYYAALCACDGSGWMWAPDQVLSFTYSKSDAPAATADVSTIAFAVASVLGCGALAVRKKR